MKHLIFNPIATKELKYSVLYYEAQSSGLGKRFLSEVEKGLVQILDHPETWPSLVYAQIRRYLIHYFPYAIVYKNTSNTIFILAIMHLSREPDYWRGRI